MNSQIKEIASDTEKLKLALLELNAKVGSMKHDDPIMKVSVNRLKQFSAHPLDAIIQFQRQLDIYRMHSETFDRKMKSEAERNQKRAEYLERKRRRQHAMET